MQMGKKYISNFCMINIYMQLKIHMERKNENFLSFYQYSFYAAWYGKFSFFLSICLWMKIFVLSFNMYFMPHVYEWKFSCFLSKCLCINENFRSFLLSFLLTLHVYGWEFSCFLSICLCVLYVSMKIFVFLLMLREYEWFTNSKYKLEQDEKCEK